MWKAVTGAVGEADRSRIRSSQFSASPSDSLDAIVKSAGLDTQPKGGVICCARPLSASGKLDIVANASKLPLFGVPTGLKLLRNFASNGTEDFAGKPV